MTRDDGTGINIRNRHRSTRSDFSSVPRDPWDRRGASHRVARLNLPRDDHSRSDFPRPDRTAAALSRMTQGWTGASTVSAVSHASPGYLGEVNARRAISVNVRSIVRSTEERSTRIGCRDLVEAVRDGDEKAAREGWSCGRKRRSSGREVDGASILSCPVPSRSVLFSSDLSRPVPSRPVPTHPVSYRSVRHVAAVRLSF